MNYSFVWLRIIALSVFIAIATSLEYSMTMKFCSDNDMAHFQELHHNIVLTRNVNQKGGNTILAAWQTIPIDHVLLHNELSWTETFNLVAKKSEGLTNAVLTVDTPSRNVSPSQCYALNKGTFHATDTASMPNYYCAENNQAQTQFMLALSQTIKGEESVVAAEKVGYKGKFQVQPNTKISILLGMHEKNEFITAQSCYPTLDVVMTTSNRVATAYFSKETNQFMPGDCPL